MIRGISRVFLAITLAAVTGGFLPALADPAPTEVKVPGIFLDCNSNQVDVHFIKAEITFVNYVRDRQAADIHVIISVRSTGSGGREYVLQFLGLNGYKGNDRELKYYSSATDSEDTRRQGLVEKLKQGLIPYISDTPMSDFISISYSGADAGRARQTDASDTWNHWSFELGLSGDLDVEEHEKGYEYALSISANRITREAKINIWAFMENEKTTYSIEDQGSVEEYVSLTKRAMVYAAYIKSLSANWSLGGFFDAYSSTYDNADIYITTGLGVEYNIFPYSEYTKRELKLRSKLEYTWRRYDTLSVYGRMRESLLRQQLGVFFALKEPWGSVAMQLSGLAYFHDLSKNHFRGDVELSINVLKGLSVHLNGNYSRIRDQLSLPAEGASKEEVLMELQQLATGYAFSLRMGLSYRFGSVYSNVVNPRF